MSTNKTTVVTLQRMMHKMDINDEIYASPQSIVSKTVEDQSLNFPQHLQQQRNRSRFFYHLRQKSKQRRLQHGPIRQYHRRQHDNQTKHLHQQHEGNVFFQYPNDLLKDKYKSITAIVGSSIARNISIKNIENETDEVRLRARSGSDCTEVLAWLKSTEGQIFMHNVNQLIFIIGTNDIHRVGADKTVQRISQTVNSVRYLYPGVNITWQLLQRRTRKTWHLSEGQAVLHEISRCNMQLTQLAAEMQFHIIQPDIPVEYMFDGLHPSADGVRMMEATIRHHLKQNKMIYSFPFIHVPSLFQISVSPPSLMSINV